nr:hypothetical protein [uncultured Psychroserpens sp.]
MKLKLALVALSLCFFTCKEESATKDQTQINIVEFDYKFPSVQKLVDCEGVDNKLFQEAVQSFEEDLGNFYTPGKPILSRGYSLFVSQAIANKVDYTKMVSPHSKKVLEALKQDESLWTTNPDGSQINFNHPIFKCIGNNIKDEQLQKTFSALIATNSMSIRMIEGQLRRKTFGMKDDKYLATYVALAFYYGKIFENELNAKNGNIVEPTEEKEHTNHDGHNH